MVETTLDFPKYQRKHLQPDTTYDTWTSLQDYANQLSTRHINSVENLELFLEQMNELDVVVGEQHAWNYIKLVQYTNDERLKEKKQKFEKDVWEKYELAKGKLRQKLLTSPFLSELIERRPELQFMMQEMQVEQRTFSEKNTAIESEISKLVDEHNALVASMRVTIEGEEMSMLPAFQKLKNPDRNIRKAAHLAIQKRRDEVTPKFYVIFDKMMKLRCKIAHNAGYENFRDYMWDKRKKIYYSPEDAEKFCHAIRDYIMPVYKDTLEKRRTHLGLDKLMTWDLRVDLGTDKPTVFFKDDKDLLEKTKAVYREIHPELSEMVSLLETRKLLDFEDRENKAMSLFSYPLPESKQSFVFLSASNTSSGVSVTFHETTHAIHNFYNHDKDIPELKSPAVEAGELFTMAMEMILADYWRYFVEDEAAIVSAKFDKLNMSMIGFRMFTLWDRFQHWAYLNPNSSNAERDDYWKKLGDEYGIGVEQFSYWHQRPHLFVVPFYMLDYAFAGLGAAAIYMNYRKNPTQTIENMIAAMKLGNTASLQDIYKTAGVNFDFSEEYVAEIADFLREEYDKLFEQLG